MANGLQCAVDCRSAVRLAIPRSTMFRIRQEVRRRRSSRRTRLFCSAQL